MNKIKIFQSEINDGVAEQVAEWSKEPSTKVGAVVADKKHRVLSLGFNGFARGVKDLAKRTRVTQRARCCRHLDKILKRWIS